MKGTDTMRYMVLHKTNPTFEASVPPTADLIAKVGAFMGELGKAGALLDGDGLRATSHGARLRARGGVATVVKGPYAGDNELTAGFTAVRAASLDEAVAWATREAAARGDVDLDIRPFTEGWDIGLAPEPPGLTTRRYMLLRKADAAHEAGVPLGAQQQAALSALTQEARQQGAYLKGATLKPSRRGRRYKNDLNGVTVKDGPFAESKELIAGYVVLQVASLEEASALALRYLQVVSALEVDLLEVEELA